MKQEMSKDDRFWEEFILIDDFFKENEKKLIKSNDIEALNKLKEKHKEDFKKLTEKYKN